MEDAADRLLRSIKDEQLTAFAKQLAAFIAQEAGNMALSESRAKALLLTTESLDTPTLNDFGRIVSNPAYVRVALYDLLDSSELVAGSRISAILPSTGSDAAVDWLSLIIGAYALKADYPLDNLDPTSPPSQFSPAGQVISQTASFVRRQVQRSATDRDKLARKLAYSADMAQSLDDMAVAPESVAPVPPHFRTPIPVRYPEVSSQTIIIDESDAARRIPGSVERGEPIRITEDDLEPPQSAVTIITGESRPVPTAPPSSNRSLSDVRIPDSVSNAARTATQAASEMASSVRKTISAEPLKMTKLRVVVQRYPDGPGIPGVQVKVQTKGVKKFVAATTNADGVFLCSLPVRARAGMTYYVDVIWPNELGGKRERKTITLNADREQFTLPYYHSVLI
ncbi:MAG: hypothetical protein M9928_07500 [Anaerolineae bacterium]|nr:hypothetical protein [Anaerolineae bacterium]MCO5195197.1 hypothetical protein [Anaerolineae bacterium]MCO5199374.1 hypothetical protein [Anaerolineae bacterium]MCO5204860.1 hypothetical protein [Anaerolineae bacterium]